MTAARDISSLVQHFGVGARASLAVTHNGVGYFAVTPQAPYDGALPAAEQARQLLAKADGRLAEIGSGKDRLLFVAIIVATMDDKEAVNAVWDAWVSDVTPPARACFEATLASPDLKVEMIMLCATGQGDDSRAS
ncbi:RidA family protein [Chelatococcus asaccharovorans]|mgnify:FL=1|uniref:RidA family protein n=1 Tax=Chelatococcus asaccharovorans TaxID=28210 RepID=UPI00224C7BB9|nr:RidA family protein [Chelatococcus asaccharovorans]CAH1649329.1 putative RutC family protein HD_0322 [Chelatococcus asaccharovorans]CAH1691492.1 putative RutC family protein HD_0322 [Chelatococcus asaccharovorans]